MRLTERQLQKLKATAKAQEQNGLGYHRLFTSAATDRTIASLERKGLVDATTDPRYAALTAAGREVLEGKVPSRITGAGTLT